MTLDLKRLYGRLAQARDEPPVPTDNVNPYLLEHVLWPLVNGCKVCYGDIDYDEFDDQDLRQFSAYCDELESIGTKLEKYRDKLAESVPDCVKVRAFC